MNFIVWTEISTTMDKVTKIWRVIFPCVSEQVKFLIVSLNTVASLQNSEQIDKNFPPIYGSSAPASSKRKRFRPLAATGTIMGINQL